MPNPFHWQETRENYFWSRSQVDRFQRDCHLIVCQSSSVIVFWVISPHANLPLNWRKTESNSLPRQKNTNEMIILVNLTGTRTVNLQSLTKLVGTLELYHVSPIPPNQCWKILRFFQQKGKNLPDYQHWKCGQGRTYFVSQHFCLGLSQRRI